jgi:hypothetical protein
MVTANEILNIVEKQVSDKLKKEIQKSIANGAKIPDENDYIVGAFDYFGTGISLMTTLSKKVANDTVTHLKKNDDVAKIIVQKADDSVAYMYVEKSNTWKMRKN